MNSQEYYATVIDKLYSCFRDFHYIVASGRELLDDGWDPHFLVTVEPVDQLEKLTCGKGLQVHLPVVGRESRSVLMPMDFEIFLRDENHKLYTDKEAQRYWFQQCVPVCGFLENLLRDRGIPYLLDYTPSGGHILWQNMMDDRATAEIEKIGYLEEDLKAACQYVDPHDIKRRDGISLEAAKVFSGLGKLAEYLSLLTVAAFRENKENGRLPVTISDSFDQCINFDNSWVEGSPFMRSIRSPFSLHKKNRDKHGVFHHPPLVDVIGCYYDGENLIEEPDINTVIDCMWDLQKASEHARKFPGIIPLSNDNLIDLIEEYRRSRLFEFHQEFEATPDIPRHAALQRAKNDHNLTDFALNVLLSPNPKALQPKCLMGFVYDLLIYADWKPKHIANVLRDLYINPSHNWQIDFFKYPAETKADFWARTFSALALWKTGRLSL